MKKSEKILLVENLIARVTAAKSLIFVNLTGLKMADQVKLRNLIRDARGRLVVVKNTLLARALDQSFTDHDRAREMKSKIEGQTAVIIAEGDELLPLQALGKFIREFELPQIKFGLIGGRLEEQEALITFSHLPSRDILQGQLVGALGGSLYGLVGVLQGNLQQLVYILNERAKVQSEKFKVAV